MIIRSLVQTILNNYKPGFITVIYGARRVGKTVLLKQLGEKLQPTTRLYLNGDTEETRNLLNTSSEVKLSEIVKRHQTIFIDEAQRIPNITLALKILIDKFPQKNIFITGSSSLELVKDTRENLTGRNISFVLYPLSTKEMSAGLEEYQKPSLLEEQLVYGGYPFLRQLSTWKEKQEYLYSIISDYLLKDILFLERVDHPETLKKLAILLAYQVGSEVSLNELSKNLGIDVKTVIRYITLLEKGFVIFNIGSYSTNLRKEIVKSKKYYFYDLGIRNALITQFAPLDSRLDIGQLWENFLFVERKKKLEYERELVQSYFWRNYEDAEVDMVEIFQGKMRAFEFKWQEKKYKVSKNFVDKYQISPILISKNNYLDFLL